MQSGEVILNNKLGITNRILLDKVEFDFVKKRLREIEYALLSTAMETGVSQEEIDLGREELLKVETGEWTDEDYRANVIKKHNLHIVDLKTPITKKSSTLKKQKALLDK